MNQQYIFRITHTDVGNDKPSYPNMWFNCQPNVNDGSYKLNGTYGPYDFNNETQNQTYQSMYGGYPEDKAPNQILINLYVKMPKQEHPNLNLPASLPFRFPPPTQLPLRQFAPVNYPKPHYPTTIERRPVNSSRIKFPSQFSINTKKQPDKNIDLISKVPTDASVSSTEYKQFLKNLDKSIENNNYDALIKFSNQSLGKLNREVGENACKHVFEKTLNSVISMDDSDYNTKTAIDKLNLISHFSSTITDNYYNDEIKKWAYDLNLNNVLKKNIQHYLYTTDSQFKDRKKGIAYVFSTLSNITFDDKQILENKNSGFIEKALDVLEWQIFFNEKNINESDEVVLYDKIIAFLWQVILVSDFSKHEVVDSNLAEKLINEKKKTKKALESFAKGSKTFEFFDVIITIILANVINEDQLKESDVANNIISTLLRAINKTIENSDKNKILNDTKYYIKFDLKNIENSKNKVITLEDCLKCFLRILTNDEIKEKTYNLKGLEPFFKIIQNDNNDKEQVLCTELLSALCTNNLIKNEIKSDQGIMKLIEEKAKNSEPKEVVRSYHSLSCSIGDKLEKRIESIKKDETKTNENPQNQHIMISYCHKDKKNALKLFEILKAKNYKIWFDETNMSEHGNVFEGMASAVENSCLILVCFSESYRISDNCKREACYASALKKNIIPIRMQPKYKPDGWLGLLINQELFFDLSSTTLKESDPIVEKVLDRINNALNEKQIVQDTQKTKSIESSTKDKSIKETGSNQSEVKDNILKWQNENVKVWLHQSGLNDWYQPLKDFDGVALYGLYFVYKNNLNSFFDIINNLLKKAQVELSIADKMKLVYGLENLSKN